MKREGTREERIRRIRTAYGSPLTVKEWCETYGASYGALKEGKWLYVNQGWLKEEDVSREKAKKLAVLVQDKEKTGEGNAVYLVGEPVRWASLEQLVNTVRYRCQRDPYSGDRYVFTNQSKKILYGLEWNGTGFRLMKEKSSGREWRRRWERAYVYNEATKAGKHTQQG